MKQEKVSGSGISWAIFKSAPLSRQITTPATHHSVFLHAGCPSCRPANSIKTLKMELVLESSRKVLEYDLLVLESFDRIMEGY